MQPLTSLRSYTLTLTPLILLLNPVWAASRSSHLLPWGAQVEQPFDILPLWQICHLATRNVEEVAFTLNEATLELEPFTLTPPIWDSASVEREGPLLADRLLVGPYWQGGPGDEDSAQH